MSLLVVFSLATWLPHGIVPLVLVLQSAHPSTFSSAIAETDDVTVGVRWLIISYVLASTSAVTSPIVYVSLNKKLRRSFVRTLFCQRQQRGIVGYSPPPAPLLIPTALLAPSATAAAAGAGGQQQGAGGGDGGCTDAAVHGSGGTLMGGASIGGGGTAATKGVDCSCRTGVRFSQPVLSTINELCSQIAPAPPGDRPPLRRSTEFCLNVSSSVDVASSPTSSSVGVRAQPTPPPPPLLPPPASVLPPTANTCRQPEVSRTAVLATVTRKMATMHSEEAAVERRTIVGRRGVSVQSISTCTTVSSNTLPPVD